MTRASSTGPRDRVRILRDLQTLPNVGKSIAADLWDLGVRSVNDLKGKDPERMYRQLCAFHNTHIDRCMLYVLRAIVHIASTDNPDPDKIMWWKWKDPVPSHWRGKRRF